MLILVSLKFHNMEEYIFSEENSNDGPEQQEKEKQQEKKKYFYGMDSYRSDFSDIHLQNSYNTGSGDVPEQQEKAVRQKKEERPEEEEQQEKKKYFYDKMSSYRSSFSSEIHLRNGYSDDGPEQQEISVLQEKEERPEKEEQQEKEGQFSSEIHSQNSYNTGSGDELGQQETAVWKKKEKRPEKEEQQEKEKQTNDGQIVQTVSRYKLFGLFGNYSEEEMQNSYFPQFFFSKYDAYEFKTLNNSVSNKNLLNYNKATTNGLNF